MRIALNAELLSFTETYRSGGISRVIYHLLGELGRDPRGHSYDVFVPAAPPPGDPLAPRHDSAALHPQRQAHPATVAANRLGTAGPAPAAGRGRSPICCTVWRTPCPSAGPGPAVVTIYDLSFLRFPAAFKTANRIYLTASTRAAVRRARRVLTISEHTRRDIVRLLNVPEQRVDVTYPAAEERYRLLPPDNSRRFQTARGLPEAFVFALGTLEPRKNLVGLLHAYARLPNSAAAAVRRWWRGLALQSHLRHSPATATSRMTCISWASSRKMNYRSGTMPPGCSRSRVCTKVSACPSSKRWPAEHPVITSTAASLPEVAGTAADPGAARRYRSARQRDAARARRSATAPGNARGRPHPGQPIQLAHDDRPDRGQLRSRDRHASGHVAAAQPDRCGSSPVPSTPHRHRAASRGQPSTADSVAPPHAVERLVLVALDIGAVNLAFYLAWFARYRLGLVVDLDPGNYVEHEVYLPLQIALSLTFAFILALRGLYRLPRAASALDDLSTIFTAAGPVGDAAVRRRRRSSATRPSRA